MSKFFIYPYENHIAQKFIVPIENIDPIIFGMYRIEKNIPFFYIDTNLDDISFFNKEFDFFESWSCDFNNPDGYGSDKTLEELIEEKNNNTTFYRDALIQFEKPKIKKISINIDIAKNIWKNKLREQRKPLLETLDVQYIRALERGQTETIQKIVKKKEFLRDIIQDPRIENAENTDDLKEVTIPPNFIEE
jgi:hypothetical protein